MFDQKRTPKSLAMAFFLITSGFAQELTPISVTPPSDPIMGFETPNSWVVKSSSALTTVAAATVRTQGSFAFAVGNPSNPTSLTSAAVASTATSLAGLGDAGAAFEADVMPPAGATGSLQLSVTSVSRGLKTAAVGQVDLKGLQAGIYNTLKFPIPEAVRTALSGASFQDLSFQFVLNATSTAGSKFLFDNLRVIATATALIPGKVGVTAPATFGGSVDLVAIGDTPVKQTFPIGSVQMPDSLRLVQGTVGSTTATLALGHDGAATFSCTYDADPSDKTGQSYRVQSCTGGAKAGDLVGVNTAVLTIVGGTPLMKLEAQLAKNPIGDLVGSQMIPAMPTFWGHSDSCVPVPVAGTVVTTTASCKNQVAEANQIVTDYFNKVSGAQAAPGVAAPGVAAVGSGATAISTTGLTTAGTATTNFVVAPVSAAALRNGTALTDGGTVVFSQTDNFPFDQGAHANKGGSFDAYWRLNGDLSVTNAANGNSSAHFDATFGTHLVLLGNDVDVVSVNAVADVANGSSPSSTGSAHVYLFGEELPGGGSVNASKTFNFNLTESTTFTVATVDVWIFSLEIDATASASLNATGTVAATGLSLTIDPKATMGTHIFGGINVVVASGGVEAKIDLLDVEAPVKAQAGLGMNPAPTECALTINFSLSASVTVSALGGEIDLVGTFGVCPFCYSDSYTLLKWAPIFKTTQNLFSVGPTTLAAIPLPVSLCSAPLTVSITSPASSADIGLIYALTSTMKDSVSRSIGCNSGTWSVTPSEPITVSSNGCQVSIQFNNSGRHLLKLAAMENIVDAFGRTITETGSASETVTVGALRNGAYIIGATPAPAGALPPYNNQTLNLSLFSFPAKVQLTGEYVGSTGTVNMTWTVTDSSGHTTTLSGPACNSPACVSTGTNQQTVIWPVAAKGNYTIKMVATDSSGKQLGTATMAVNVFGLSIGI